MITDRDGNRLVIGGIYNFDTMFLGTRIKILDLKTTGCFSAHCKTVTDCLDTGETDEWGKLYALIKIIRGSVQDNKFRQPWVYHMDEKPNSEYASLFDFSRTDRIIWFDIWGEGV